MGFMNRYLYRKYHIGINPILEITHTRTDDDEVIVDGEPVIEKQSWTDSVLRHSLNSRLYGKGIITFRNFHVLETSYVFKRYDVKKDRATSYYTVWKSDPVNGFQHEIWGGTHTRVDQMSVLVEMLTVSVFGAEPVHSKMAQLSWDLA